jgi:hypothetical protein
VVIDAANSALNQAQKTLNAVGVDVSANVDALFVRDGTVTKTQRLSFIIAEIANATLALEFVCIDHASGYDVFLDFG